MSQLDASTQDASTQLVPLPRRLESGYEQLERARSWPFRVVLEVPVVGFTVRSLMELQPGVILETGAAYNEELMLQVNGEALGRAKFDVTGQLLAVRMTGVS